MTNQNNPLLTKAKFPLFSSIKPEYINPAIDSILAKNRAKIAELTAKKSHDFNDILEIENLEDTLSKAWSQVSHLNSVVSSPKLRDEHEIAEQKLTEYHSEISHNKELFEIYKQVAETITENTPEKKLLSDAIRDFKLSGVDLNKEEKKKYTQLLKELSNLSNKFSNNILDCTDEWSLEITDQKLLAGIPWHVLNLFKKDNKYIFNLQAPTYIAIMQYADNREIRKKFYDAYTTRASDAGEHNKKYDNTDVMFQILTKKFELAKILGFANYAEESLATKMAKSTQQVLDFLHDLVKKVRPKAQKEFAELIKFSGLEQLEPWDVAYYSEKMRIANFAISDDLLRKYFPLNKVKEGLFKTVEKLYGIKIVLEPNTEVWHPDVKFFKIIDSKDNIIGYFYFDLFARDKKRGGAWMDECRSRKKINDELQLPIAYLTCNFTPADQSGAANLTHDEVITLFHEFGHGLHHLLTKIDYPSISGINGVPWDGVELPSQFLESWCWQKESLQYIADNLPDDLLEKMLAAKNFQQALSLIRQLEFALFDFVLHEKFDCSKDQTQIQHILNKVRAEVSVIPAVENNRFQHSFSHIFAGGYAAGYYSYLWAEVLAADAFSKFLEDGIFNQQTAQSFLHNILEKGGSQDFLQLFVKFRGREPQVDALLHERGIV